MYKMSEFTDLMCCLLMDACEDRYEQRTQRYIRNQTFIPEPSANNTQTPKKIYKSIH